MILSALPLHQRLKPLDVFAPLELDGRYRAQQHLG